MRQKVEFLLDGERRSVGVEDPTLTLLDYLRGAERRCGTKEGCAEGDCGACTVALGELVDGEIRYRAVNACILFLPVIDGKELVTVESLASAPDRLHPVQEAMVETHASQCGFCTPGFVMSLFTLFETSRAPDRPRIEDALAGNLCRCTGYRPIVEAALRADAAPRDGRFAPGNPDKIAALSAFATAAPLGWEGEKGSFFAPTSATALAALLERHPDAVLLGGGTDVGLWVTKQHKRLPVLIYTGRVAELRRVAVGASAIEIGAAVPYAELQALLAEEYPDFGEILRRLGSVQIRNLGTIGGNIANASPIGDTPPLLLALDASLSLRRGEAMRQLPLEQFFLDYRRTALRPGEFIEGVILPRPRPGLQFRAYKIAKRYDQDISALCAAFALTLEAGKVADIRIAFGGMAAVPRRAQQCEAALLGRPWNEAGIAPGLAALDRDFAPLSDLRASADYRRAVAANLLRKFLIETSGGTAPTRLRRPAEAAA